LRIRGSRRSAPRRPGWRATAHSSAPRACRLPGACDSADRAHRDDDAREGCTNDRPGDERLVTRKVHFIAWLLSHSRRRSFVARREAIRLRLPLVNLEAVHSQLPGASTCDAPDRGQW
jgi:hypothetical protein